MQPQTWTAKSIKSHQSELKQRIHEFIPLKDSVLREAHARGLGFRTEAALTAALKATPELSARAFSHAAFTQRVGELIDDVSTEVVTEILDGVKLDISVIKRSEQRQSADRHSDVAYDVVVTLSGISTAILDSDIVFHLPEFGRDAGLEPYRVDSAHDRRALTDYRKTRFGAGQATIVAKLGGGSWHGGFYIYAAKHQADDTLCIRSLKAALTRAILPQLPTRLRCAIFKPDGYQMEVWRVEMRLSPGIQHFWSRSPFQFDIPQLPKRLFIMESEYCVGPYIGRFVDGIWKADLNSNGIEEMKNPTSLLEVKRALLQCVEQLALNAGYVDEGKLTPVFGDDGKMIGTVQLRDGRYEAWNRIRTVDRPGNSHKFLGRFGSLIESVSAIKSSF